MQSVPYDILCNILSLLPLKSLIRLTYVCKRWLSIIRDPTFGKLHFTRSESEPATLVLTYNVIGKKKAIDISYMTKQKGPKLVADQTAIVNMISPHSWHLVGTCDGLLCFATSGRDEIVMVCNPVTREHVMLPKSSPCPKSHRLMYAFGFDPITEKYKVVRVLCHHNLHIKAEVCAVGDTGSWRKVEGFDRVPYGKRPIYAKGAVYWFAEPYPKDLPLYDHLRDSALINLPIGLTNQLHVYQRERILSFDFGKEKFRMMRHMRISHLSSLAELDKCLSIINININSSNTLVEVYAMKDSTHNSWKKEYSIPVQAPRFFDWKSPGLICEQERKGFLLIWLQHTLMICKRKGNARRKLKVTEFPIGTDFEICSGYRGSLVSVTNFNAATEDQQSATRFTNDEALYSNLEGNFVSREYKAARRCASFSKCLI